MKWLSKVGTQNNVSGRRYVRYVLFDRFGVEYTTEPDIVQLLHYCAKYLKIGKWHIRLISYERI